MFYSQENSYPWMAALIKEEDKTEEDYVYTQCSGSLVSCNQDFRFAPRSFFDQIGSTWVVTAAHCVYGKDGEMISERTLSILLGLHNRGKNDYQEPKRWDSLQYFFFYLFPKKPVRISS